MDELIFKTAMKIMSEAGLVTLVLMAVIYFLYKDRARLIADSKETTKATINALQSNTEAITEFKESLAFLSGSITHQHK